MLRRVTCLSEGVQHQVLDAWLIIDAAHQSDAQFSVLGVQGVAQTDLLQNAHCSLANTGACVQHFLCEHGIVAVDKVWRKRERERE